MGKKINLKEEQKIFQSQLASLLSKGIDLSAAVDRIESEADFNLSGLIASAKKKSTGGNIAADDKFNPIVENLAMVGLLSSDTVHLLKNTAGSSNVQKNLNILLLEELESKKLNSEILEQMRKLLWGFLFVSVFALVIFSFYSFKVLPEMFSINRDLTLPASARAFPFFLFSLLLMALFLCFLAIMCFMLRLELPKQMKIVRMLWSIPGSRILFRKWTSWRVLTNCHFLIKSGTDQATAIDASIRSFGLLSIKKGAVAHFPLSKFFDASSIRAVNLGASLDTFEEQLKGMIEILKQELPSAAQDTTRVVYYLGYMILSPLVAAILIQMYEPVYRLANVFY